MKLLTDFGNLNILEYKKLIKNELDNILKLEDKYFKLIELNSLLNLLYGQNSISILNENDSILMEIISDYILNSNPTKDPNDCDFIALKQNFYNVLNENEFVEIVQTHLKRKELSKCILEIIELINSLKQDIINPTTDLKLLSYGSRWLFNGNINTLCYMLFEVNYPKFFEVDKPDIFESGTVFRKAIIENYLVKKNDKPTELSIKSITTYYNNINNDKLRYKSKQLTDPRLYKDLESSLKTISKKYLIK